MKKAIISSLFSLLLINLLNAQETNENSTTQVMGGGGFIIGYGNMSISKFQSFIPGNMGSFKKDFIVIGGTGHAMMNKFVIGGTGFAIIGDAIKTDSIKASPDGGVGTFDIGYLLLDKSKIKIYPMLGIGGTGFGLQISKTRNLPISTVVDNPGQEINISHAGFVTDISININLIPVLEYDEKNDSYGGFMTGIKIGYIYSLPSSDWSFSGGDIIGGPSFGLNMVYVKLIIGGFGIGNK